MWLRRQEKHERVRYQARLPAFGIFATAAILVSAAFGQNATSEYSIYFLKDDSANQWCGYISESQFKTQMQSLPGYLVGDLRFVDGSAVRIRVQESDQTGDWAVNDEYTVAHSKIQALRRFIDILPEHYSEEQDIQIQDGRIIHKHSTRHNSQTGQPIGKSVDWFKSPAIATRVEKFPFWALIQDKRGEVLAKGEACVSAKNP